MTIVLLGSLFLPFDFFFFFFFFFFSLSLSFVMFPGGQYQRKSGKKPSSTASSSKKTLDEGSSSPSASPQPGAGKGKKASTKTARSQPGSDDGGSGNSSDDDSHSTGSQGNDAGETNQADEPQDDGAGMKERVSELLENLSAKRASTREEALLELKKNMTGKVLTLAFEGRCGVLASSLFAFLFLSFFPFFFCDLGHHSILSLSHSFSNRLETLMDSLKRSLRRGSSVENTLAAECLSLSFLLVGSNNEGIFSEVRPILQETIRNSQDDSPKPAVSPSLFSPG